MSPRRREPGSASPTGRAGSRPARSSRGAGLGVAAATAGVAGRPRGRSASAASKATARPGAAAGGTARRGFASGFTGRAAILAVVVCALLLTLAYPVRQYIGQRAQIAAVQASIADQRAQLNGLQQQLDRWNDPAYVRAQARERLHFVKPGETQYIVVEDGTSPSAARDARPGSSSSAAASTKEAEAKPWYETLWASVQQADKR
ncbi:MAG: FtsB family cell division protein [Actinomycetes bacterium]